MGFLLWTPFLKNIIVKGDLNPFILRPINPFVGFTFINTNYNGAMYLFLTPIFYFIVLTYLKVQLENVILGLCMFFIILILNSLFVLWFKSLDFLLLGLSQISLGMEQDISSLIRTYPEPFFKGTNFRFIFLLFPYFLIGSLLVPILRGYEIWRIDIQLAIIISMIIIFSFGIYFNWHYGLKNYEAFG